MIAKCSASAGLNAIGTLRLNITPENLPGPKPAANLITKK